MRRQFTSECVTSAHPDKLCDQISDALLDAFLEGDSLTRAAIETTACPDFIHVMGEVSTTAQVDVDEVARSVVRRVGYTKDEYLFTNRIRVVTSLHRQSDDIAMGVDRGEVLGAGDQGMMFGYATGECANGMPLTMNLARALTTRLTEKRRDGSLPFLRPDGKGQVTIEYENGKAKRIAAVVLSAQHDEDITLEDLRAALKEEVILPCLPEDLLDGHTKNYINPTGRFVLGGPAADTGLTGRKLIVDTYGGWAPHGGGAFSGKDATKVDRSAAYAARNIALTLVRARIAKRCLVQLAYAIGVSEPVGIFVDTYSSGLVDEEKLARFIREHWDLSPKGIIDEFELRKPGYAELSEVGHFGGDQRWEKVDSGRVEALKRLLWDER